MSKARTLNPYDMEERINKLEENDTSNKAAIDAVDDKVAEMTERFNYSTTEHVVGKWIDGSTVYEKVINFGALPNTNTKTVAHGISNFGGAVEISGIANNTSTGTYISLTTASNNFITPFVNGSEIGVTTGADRSSYDECYFYLRYTKNN